MSQVVLGLEGGYVGEEVGEAVVECVRALLGDGVVLQDADQLNRQSFKECGLQRCIFKM